MNRFVNCIALSVATLVLINAAHAQQEQAKPPTVLDLADGKLQLPIAAAWKSVKPRSRIIQHEFSIPSAEGDGQPGRLTIMAAGGGIEANLARWAGQFRSADGKPLADDAKKVEKKTISTLDVHIVDITGSYQDKPRGPFGPSVNRPDYRMLAAIVVTKNQGAWFIKSYGPQKTMTAAKPAFNKMIESIVWKP